MLQGKKNKPEPPKTEATNHQANEPANLPQQSGDTPDPFIDMNLTLKAENELLKLQIETLETKISELSATKVPTKPAGTAQTPPFNVGGKLYRLKQNEISIRRVGKRTALDIVSDDEPYNQLGGLSIKEWLVANSSTAIEEIAKEN